MRRDDTLRILRTLQDELRQRFRVSALWLFGSVARDQAAEHSDVDLLVEFERPTGYFMLYDLQQFLEGRLGSPVDVGTKHSLKPRVREAVLGEVIHV